MKILAISHEFPPIGGGGANACYFLTKGFVEKGHEVTLITANYEGMPEEELINGVHVVRVNSKRAYKEHCSFQEMSSYLMMAYPVAKRLQKEEKYDACLVFFGIPSGPIGYLLKKKYKLPYIIRFGGGDVPGFQERFTKVYKLIAPAIKIIWKNADALIANSQGLKDMALSFYDKKDFEIICNGVDTDVFYPNRTEEANEFKILFVSRLIERKGLQFIIPNLLKLKDVAGRKITMTIVGDGPYRAELEKLVYQYHLEEVVRFEGQKSKIDIIKYYQNSDVFILPSKKEGMPNVVLEAMASGLPIIMTPCEGSTELIDDNGYITNTSEMIDKLILLEQDEELRSRLGKNSRNKVKQEFSWNKIVENYLDALQVVTKNS